MNILIIEDDQSVGELERDYLEMSGGFHCTLCTDGTVGLQEALAGDWAMVIVDVMLPGLSGFEICRRLREEKDVPVMIISALADDIDKVRGLGLGADDYITKPFSLMVLRTRIHKALEKAGKKDSPIYRRNGFFFDFEKMYCCKNGEELQLSKTEQKLLSTLVRNRNITITRDVLVDRIWTDGGEFVDENALSVVIKRLRDKLEQDSSKPQYIQTVYGKGYVWKD